MKVFCAGNQDYETSWLLEIGASLVYKIEEAELVLFNGGTDVDAALYNQKRSRYAEHPDRARDAMEKAQYEYCVENGIKMCGTCRGSQFLTVMNGGSLIQHVNNHTNIHQMYTSKGQNYSVGSWHHQMMYPFDVKNKAILAWSIMLSDVHINGNDRNIDYPTDFVEPEVVYYPKTNSLCIQSHPDWVKGNVRTYFQGLVLNLMEGTLPKSSTKYKSNSIENVIPKYEA